MRQNNPRPARNTLVRLAARDGQHIPDGIVPAIDAPETMMVVSFTGLTEAEQRAALAGFPGGARFQLECDVERERQAS